MNNHDDDDDDDAMLRTRTLQSIIIICMNYNNLQSIQISNLSIFPIDEWINNVPIIVLRITYYYYIHTV